MKEINANEIDSKMTKIKITKDVFCETFGSGDANDDFASATISYQTDA